MYKISKYTEICEIPSNTIHKDMIVYSTRSGNMITIKENFFNLITQNRFEEVDFRIINLLLKYNILVNKDEDEIRSILEENSHISNKKDGLSFTIQPTGNCQLGCHYCGQSHSKIKMSDKLIEKSYERISKLVKDNNYKLLSVTWYGGEPLMAFDQIVKFSEKIKHFSLINEINYKADIITNGLLLKVKNFERLVADCNIKHFQITLDGTKEIHDQRRMTKGGKGSFDIILKNIEECINSDVFKDYLPSINIRLNINKENCDSVDDLIDIFSEKKLLDKISFSFSPVFDWGGNNANKDSLSMNEFSEKEINWILKINDLGGNIQVSLPERQSVPCMVGVENSEVHDAFGNVFSCYELPYTDKYQNSDYIEGNLLKDPDNIVKNNELRNFSKTIEERKYSNCIDCKFYPVCGGACPKSWINGEVACPTFKYNMSDKMLLHYYLKKSRQN